MPDQDRPMAPRRPPGDEPGPWRWLRTSPYRLLLLILLVWTLHTLWSGTRHTEVGYSEFKQAVKERRVTECRVGEQSIEGKLRRPVAEGEEDGGEVVPFRTARVEDPDLVQELGEAGVPYAGVEPSAFSPFLLLWLLPLGLMVLFTLPLLRGGLGSQKLAFGRSRARIVPEKSIKVSFRDVAGCEEAKQELREIVEFLRDPGRFTRLGARIPKGVLLVGPPGTGKTLLARAVAGEASVPFFSISGSEFVEMFVGVGAARVRDLFEQAKAKAPCLIFVDEVDAIGRHRGVQFGAVNDEREQTLNQLLVEMDGFEPNSGVILLAATNRPDVLDRALLRPGRFDRQVVLDAPDLTGREAILVVHTQGKPMAADVDLHRLAQGTPGFSGADLANAVNEAALLAARRGHAEITHADLEDAVEKVVAGPERRSRRLGETEKRRVAFHESGHALVALHSPGADPVHKISIVPRGHGALGYTLQTPDAETYLLTRAEILDRVRGLLGGRAAEDLVLGEVSTGAQNDLERATALVRQMVCVHGMSDALGLLHCARRDGAPFLPAGDAGSYWKDCSEETAARIDAEVQRVLGQAYAEAKELLARERAELDALAEGLLRHETLDRVAIREILERARSRNGPREAGAPLPDPVRGA